jgi:demethylmenaquinone methyltransferase/2-methoxy-6-polyprenyl-1,4-benzoquinol methylase
MPDAMDERIAEQIDYYRKRAPEYDAWANREDGFDRGELNEGWYEEKRRLAEALRSFAPTGTVLEIAGGTGQWTEQLLRYTPLLTVLDAAPVALEENRKRTAQHTKMIDYHLADIFSWEPPERYDVVFFSYWLSHVPPERFEELWEKIGRCLKPAGRVFLIDNLPTQEAEALDPETPGEDDVSVLRRAPDGKVYRVWKVLWRPEELRKVMLDLGWDLEVFPTGDYFLWAQGTHTGVRQPPKPTIEDE